MPTSREGVTTALQYTTPYHHFRSLSHRMAAEREGARPLHPHTCIAVVSSDWEFNLAHLAFMTGVTLAGFERFKSRRSKKQKKAEHKSRSDTTPRVPRTLGPPRPRARFHQVYCRSGGEEGCLYAKLRLEREKNREELKGGRSKESSVTVYGEIGRPRPKVRSAASAE